jgi:hypothetical protein
MITRAVSAVRRLGRFAMWAVAYAFLGAVALWLARAAADATGSTLQPPEWSGLAVGAIAIILAYRRA